MTQRIRGYRGQQLRRARLQYHPTCADCAARGIVKATEELNHVTPL